MCRQHELTEEYKGWNIYIVQDELDYSPREEYDNFGTMVCWHSHYDLGDEQPRERPKDYLINMIEHDSNALDVVKAMVRHYRKTHEWSWRGDEQPELSEVIDEMELDESALINILERVGYIFLPLYLFDHSGLSMSTSSSMYRAFDSMGWDWGQVGFIYAAPETIVKEFDGDHDKAVACLRGEVETYDQYLTGDVWGYEVSDQNSDAEESCWSFYGYKYCLEEARAVIDYAVADQPEQLAEAEQQELEYAYA